MSQDSTTTAMTTTPQWLVSSSMASLSSVTVAPSLMGLPATLGQHDVVLPPLLTLRCSGGVIGLATVSQQQPPSPIPFQAYANYAMGSPWVGFFFSELSFPPFCILYVCCLFWCLLSTFRCHNGCHIHPWGAQMLGFAPLQPIGAYPWQAYVQPGNGHQPTPGMHRVAAPSTALSRGSLLLLNQLFPSHPICMVGHAAFGAW